MLNPSQEKIVKSATTPAAVIAGPGTGKTHTIVSKVGDLVENHGVEANKILITTFTKKAAAELNTRIIAEFNSRGINTDLRDLKIGNFHNIANTYLDKYRHKDRGFFSPKSLDTEQEAYFIAKNISNYDNIDGFSRLASDYKIEFIQNNFQYITNNLVDLESLKNSNKPDDTSKYQVYILHERLLRDNNLVNFQLMLRDFYDLLSDTNIRNEIVSDIDFVIIDEYQDTNYIQQEIAFKLVKDRNIMVFGDDDQSLYSFRGADPRNLTNFAEICEDKLGKVANIYRLDTNYRSYQEIIDFADSYMENQFFEQRPAKNLLAAKGPAPTNSLVAMASNDVASIVKLVKDLSIYVNLSQIAFLFPSLRHYFPNLLQEEFEKAGIPVINHSISSFFYREEIRVLMYIFAEIYSAYPQFDPDFYPESKEELARDKYNSYLKNLIDDGSFKTREILEFTNFCKKNKLMMNEVFYRALELDFFQESLSQKLGRLETDRAQNNIASFSQKIAEYEEIFCKDTSYNPAEFIGGYMFAYFKSNTIKEFAELDTSYNAVNFMTIHNSKGLEFDVVFVSSLYEYLNRANTDLERARDFYRKYYTAFTRAKNLLVLFDNSNDFELKDLTGKLPTNFEIEKLGLNHKENKSEIPILAFTTDIEVYETCPLQYKFLGVLGFREALNDYLLYGSRVHQLAEELNNRKIRGKSIAVIEEFIAANPDYQEPVASYIKRDFNIIGSEVNYKADRGFYILQGNIDAITVDNSILDIKTGTADKDRLKKYQKQLITYKNLMLLNNEQPNDLYLYFINHDKLIKVADNGFDIEVIDRIAREIINENFYEKTADTKPCKYCPMRYHCRRY